jgi:hypothetical protein
VKGSGCGLIRDSTQSLKKNKRAHTGDSTSPGYDLNTGTFECGAGVPTARQQETNEEL